MRLLLADSSQTTRDAVFEAAKGLGGVVRVSDSFDATRARVASSDVGVLLTARVPRQ